MPHARTTRTLVAALVTGVLLAGCSLTPSASSPTLTPEAQAQQTPAATSAPTSSPTPSPTAPAPIRAGDTLTDAQVATLPENVVAYELLSGKKVAIVKLKPVPKAVNKDVQKRFMKQFPGRLITVPGDDTRISDQRKAYEDWRASMARATGGRYIVIVASAWDIAGPNAAHPNAWGYTKGRREFPTRAAAVKAAKRTAKAMGLGIVVVHDL